MLNDFTVGKALIFGGPVMYVLILCSIFSVAVILERLFYYHRRSRVQRVVFMQSIREQIEKPDFKKALMVCKDVLTPFSTVTEAGLNSLHLDEKEITEAMERKIVVEIHDLEHRTAIVGTIGSTAVYIGLLGTVLGIIRTFQDIYQAGSSGINVVIHGISEALVCTAAGLFVAIPAVMAYNYFIKRVKWFIMDMELCASETASLIKGQKTVKAR